MDLRSGHDQRIAVIGMGRTGQSVAAFLLRNGISCECFDEQKVTLPETLDMPLHIGRLKAEALKGFDRVVVSPGINWNHPELCKVRDAGIPIFGDLELFGEHYRGDIIAVTGTNGKTTTVNLISTLLDTLPGGIEAAGNIGRPMLDLLAEESTPRVVLELSSFQLERSRPLKPKWAALLNLQPDHADMHENSAAYRAAKLKLFEYQGDGDKAALPADSEWDGVAEGLKRRGVFVRRFGIGDPKELDCGIEMLDRGRWRLFWHQFQACEYIDADALPLNGLHQHINLAVAAQAATDFGVSISVVRQALTSFRGLPHRMQPLGVIAGHEWFNDSKATNPDAAKAALDSFHEVVWICGGLRKGLDLASLQQSVVDRVAQVFVIGKDPKPFVAIADAAGVPVTIAKTVEHAVKLAAATRKGLPVLLSPAAASQDQFRDYGERGDAFMAAVAALEKSA